MEEVQNLQPQSTFAATPEGQAEYMAIRKEKLALQAELRELWKRRRDHPGPYVFDPSDLVLVRSLDDKTSY